ncbi:unnamed protein product [Spirodela intermedia]|uniref:Uncharacterized protein n=1 Tax=Spirodela intermedia TaxID=51605 RepID=A0A7I8II38_SPIIN|nr:unnamed protein product [Spirodela intermedia]CAA6657543.1 unnamed protein product [Spirodela intermedia]
MGCKHDELKPFAVEEQLPGVDYCINSPPPWREAILLGFQNYVVSLGAIVLVANILVRQIGGRQEEKAKLIQTMVFVSGINTLLQVNFGTRLPVVIGRSQTFILPTLSIIFRQRCSDILDPHERFIHTMRAIQGALIIASSLQISFGFLGIWGVVVRYLSPLAAVPLVTLAGLGAAKCVEIGLPAIILLVFLSQYVPSALKRRRVIFDRFALTITVVIVWVYAFFLTVAGAYKHAKPSTQFSCRADRADLIGASPWIRVPYPLQWEDPPSTPGRLCDDGRLSGCSRSQIAAQRFASSTPVPPSVFSRGVGWQGIGILLDGLFGTANGSTVSVENAGLLGLTKVGSRRAIEISACFMLFFSVLGKFGAILASIPLPIFAGLYCILFPYVGGRVGLLQFCSVNSFRTKFILGFSLFLGTSVAQYFREYSLFNDIVNVVFSSPVMVGSVVAYSLDSSVMRGDAQKFRTFDGDCRSAEFYSLPYNLSKYFPSY